MKGNGGGGWCGGKMWMVRFKNCFRERLIKLCAWWMYGEIEGRTRFARRFLTWNMAQFNEIIHQFSSVTQLCPTLCNPWITAHQASLSITNSRSSLRLTSITSVMPSSHLILCHPLLLLPLIAPSIRIFSNESILRMRWPKYWSFSFSIIPSKEIHWSCMDVRVGLWRRLSAEELMLLNCGVGEDSWKSLGLQDPTSQF